MEKTTEILPDQAFSLEQYPPQKLEFSLPGQVQARTRQWQKPVAQVI